MQSMLLQLHQELFSNLLFLANALLVVLRLYKLSRTKGPRRTDSRQIYASRSQWRRVDGLKRSTKSSLRASACTLTSG